MSKSRTNNFATVQPKKTTFASSTTVDDYNTDFVEQNSLVAIRDELPAISRMKKKQSEMKTVAFGLNKTVIPESLVSVYNSIVQEEEATTVDTKMMLKRQHTLILQENSSKFR